MTEQEPTTAPEQAVQLALRVFGENLRLAFVGGSYARGSAGATSDVDVFVVMRHPERNAERAFAQALRDLHETRGLDFDHCGEVLDEVTLDELLAFTAALLNELPAIQRMSCYQADCLLSVFRKGDVIYKFLDDAKIHCMGDLDHLKALEARAHTYFHQHPMPRVQELKGQLSLPADSVQARSRSAYEARMAGPDWLDTPVGVGLERWFARHRLPALGTAVAPQRHDGPPSSRCPLPGRTSPGEPGAVTATPELVRSQCLAFARRGVPTQSGGPTS